MSDAPNSSIPTANARHYADVMESLPIKLQEQSHATSAGGLLSLLLGDWPDDAEYRCAKISLRFSDSSTERRFAHRHLERALPTARLFLIAASVLYALFSILDVYTIPEIRLTAWIIRFGFICPSLLGVALLSRWSGFYRCAQPVLAACVFAAGSGIVIMIALAAKPGATVYYAGLIMVVIYGASLISLRCVYASAVSAIIVAMYNVVAIFINAIPANALLSNDFFLGMSLAIGIFASYVQERQARRDFISTEMLQIEKSKSDRLRSQAEASNRAKSDFLATMSHELRTPLNAILGFSEIIKLQMFGPLGSARYTTYVSDIHSTGQHLLSVINDILDLSRAEAGKITIVDEEMDLHATATECLQMVRAQASQMELRLSLESNLAGGWPNVRADPRLIKQVFLNILGNAIKFTPAGGSISVTTVSEDDGSLTVRFKDSGIGIAESDLARVVQPFAQIENIYSRKHGGTGLGLPIAKRIMEIHGGELSLQSKLGCGTTIVLHLPADRVLDDRRATQEDHLATAVLAQGQEINALR